MEVVSVVARAAAAEVWVAVEKARAASAVEKAVGGRGEA